MLVLDAILSLRQIITLIRTGDPTKAQKGKFLAYAK